MAWCFERVFQQHWVMKMSLQHNISTPQQYRPVKSLRRSDAYMRQLTNHLWFREWLVAWPAPSHYQKDAGLLLIGPLGTNFCEILIRIQAFSFKKMHLKMSSAKCRRFGLNLNVLNIVVARRKTWPLNLCYPPLNVSYPSDKCSQKT